MIYEAAGDSKTGAPVNRIARFDQDSQCQSKKVIERLLAEHRTDVGNGRRLALLHGDDLKYSHGWEKWLVWDGKRWKMDDTGEIHRRAKSTCRSLLEHAADRIRELSANGADENTLKSFSDFQSFAIKSESRDRISAMAEMAKSEPNIPIQTTALNSDPFLLCCPNGTVDLSTGSIRPHDRCDYITQLCPTPYVPDATCPTWIRFLNDIFPGDEAPGNIEMILYVQRLLGYCLTGDVREQILPIFCGSGSNGKTTLLNTVTTILGSDYCVKAPVAMLTAGAKHRHPTELTLLFGKRLVYAAESDEGGRLNESVIKELTGSETITARRMKEDFWSFVPTHKLILCTNHKPKVRGKDHAIWRRLKLVPFMEQFDGARKDTTLPAKLLAEATGILAWLIRGCVEWHHYGLTEPNHVREATKDYRKDEDVLAVWIDQRCTTSGKEQASVLYQNYKAWAENGGEYVQSIRQFTKELRDSYKDYTSNGLWFNGLSLRHQ